MAEQSPGGPPSPTPTPGNPTPPARTGCRRWVWALLAVLVLFGLVIFVAIRRQGKAKQAGTAAASPAPIPVTVIAARQGDMGIYVNGLGSVTPVYTVMVRSRVDGQLMSVNYRQGELVREGDLLVEIDPRPFQAQLLQAQGQYERDKALLENALIDLKRYQTAYLKNAVPEQTVATQQATVHQDQGTVKLDQALVETAQLQLTYCRITSPISGRVGLRLVDPGNIVHATDTNPLVVVTEVQPITVIFSVAEDYLPQIQEQLRQGRRLLVEAFDRSQQFKIAEGYVEALDNLIDPSTGTLRIRALFQNEQAALFPNQFVNARLLVNTLQNVTLVPGPAVQRNSQGAFIYVVKPDHTIAVQPVQPLAADGAWAAVKGVAPGQTIATDNFNRLQQGSKVALRSSPPPTNPGVQHGLTQNAQPAQTR